MNGHVNGGSPVAPQRAQVMVQTHDRCGDEIRIHKEAIRRPRSTSTRLLAAVLTVAICWTLGASSAFAAKRLPFEATPQITDPVPFDRFDHRHLCIPVAETGRSRPTVDQLAYYPYSASLQPCDVPVEAANERLV